MLKFLRLFFKNLHALGTINLHQMIDFERTLMLQHNALVEDVKAINTILRKESGYDAGYFIRPRPRYTDEKQPHIAPLFRELAANVENYLMMDEQRLARVNPPVEPVPSIEVFPIPPPRANLVRKPTRKRRRTK